MKVLIVGGGGREHAIAWKLKRDDESVSLTAAPGNPGIAEFARCVAVQPTDVPGVVQLAAREKADLTVVGPEAPLAAGLVDALRVHGLRAFGPTSAAARIESSKRFAKELMLRSGVPTAAATWHDSVESAKRAVRVMGAPVVVKASGLASGKGVFVCQSESEADTAIESMLLEHRLGASGYEILVEEFMDGEELSVFVLTDGLNWRLMLPAQDHKRLLDGDAGPNTGGMGAYAPVSLATPDLIRDIEDRIVDPTLAALREHGSEFAGLLYCGLMIGDDGPRVVEFNCRFGDPETQVVLPLMISDLCDAMLQCTESGGMVDAPALRFRDGCTVTTVVATPGYPNAASLGAPVDLSNVPDDVLVFHSGTRRDAGSRLVSAGGRVVSMTAVSDTMDQARQKSRLAAESVGLEGKILRSDIGWRELSRRAGAA